MTRTRFAPSPTGYMHVGNLRTALFAYLTARHDAGAFVLRIEDTDQGRLVAGATDVIYDTLRASGLTWDEGPDIGGAYGPYVQSERMAGYAAYADGLVAAGHAYRCFCTPERLAALREAQVVAGEEPRYDGRCRGLSAAEVDAAVAAGKPHVVRQKIPDAERVVGFDDLVYGRIEVNSGQLEDLVLMKSDGFPTYNFANVVDDHEMAITHVIRGSEYLSSTPKYQLLYEAFGWAEPTYVHCPPVMKDKQTKLSKRNGDASFQDLVARGFLPEGIVNYLLLLGWSPADEIEVMSLAEAVERWDPTRINKSPAIFDPVKLASINAEHIRALPADQFRALAEPWIARSVSREIDVDLLAANLQPRCQFLGEIPEQVAFLERPEPLVRALFANAKHKTTPEGALGVLGALEASLAVLPDWTRDAIFAACDLEAAAAGLKRVAVLMPLGIALSGRAQTPGGGADVAAVLGRDETLGRLRAAVAFLTTRD